MGDNRAQGYLSEAELQATGPQSIGTNVVLCLPLGTIREIFDVAGGAECRRQGTHREFAAIRIRTRIRSPETK
jgi:hypothetical protein